MKSKELSAIFVMLSSRTKMKKVLLTISLVFFMALANAQAIPPEPVPCNASGNLQINVTGSTAFNLSSLADFSQVQTDNNLVIRVRSSKQYRLYIAGEIVGLAGSADNSPIPVSTFSVSVSNPGTAPTGPIQLTGTNYQVVADNTAAASGRDHRVTLTRGLLNTFTQAPGVHTLYLHIKVCQ